MGWGHRTLPYSPPMGVPLVLASGCQSRDVMAGAAGPDTFSCEDLLRPRSWA